MSEDPRIDRLFSDEDRLPRAVVDEILLDGARLAPRLLEILGDRALWDEEPPRCWAPFHATLLLPAMRPPPAFDGVLRALEWAYESYDDLIADLAPSILAGYVGPELEPVRSVLRDRQGDRFLREDACTALVAAAGARPELLPAVAAELRQAAADPSAPKDLRALSASHLLGLADPRDREFLLGFERNEYFDREYVDEIYERQVRAPFPPVEDWLTFYDPDRIAARQAESEEGHVHDEGEPGDLDGIDPGEIVKTDVAADLLDAAAADPDALPPPFRREAAKVGRNDPCPCGSGAKFKKCCGR